MKTGEKTHTLIVALMLEGELGGVNMMING